MATFNEFYGQWKDVIRVTTSADLTRGLYFQDDRDDEGFDILPDFFKEYGEEWAILVASKFEARSSLAGRLDKMGLAKFRMIFDRHLLNLSKTKFDEEYLRSSDERALFLIHEKVPPVRVSSALNSARNASFDFILLKSEGIFSGKEKALFSAISTLFMIEMNHIMRVYVYYAQQNSKAADIFKVVMRGDDACQFDYAPPTTNGQMSYPDKSKYGMVDLF